MDRRNNLDICADILKIALDGARNTEIVFGADLNFTLSKKRQGKLVDKGYARAKQKASAEPILSRDLVITTHMPPSNSKNEKWIDRGLVTASECYSCRNRLDSRVDGGRIRILCRDECNFIPSPHQQVRARN